jgi:hypothetical protein
MTYDESALLMTNLEFRGRVKVASLKYADSITLEANTVPAHNTRLRWAQQCFTQPDMVAGQIQPPVVMDPAVQLAGSDITDAALQGAVEGVVNKML